MLLGKIFKKSSKNPLLATQTSRSQFGKPHPQGGKELQSSQLAEVGGNTQVFKCRKLFAVAC